MMQSVISSSISNARTSGSVDEVPPRKTASTPDCKASEPKRPAQALDHEAVAQHGADVSSQYTSTSPRFRAACPVQARELQYAPLIDECIARLYDEKKDSVKPSPSFLTTYTRGQLNSNIGFVPALRLSTVQTVLAHYVSMNDLAAIANTCSAISGSLNLGDEKSRKMWQGLVDIGRKDRARKAAEREAYYTALENMPEPSNKRRQDDDEEVAYAPSWRPHSRGSKRVKASFSVSVDD